MKKQNILFIAALALVIVVASSCGPSEGDYTGKEYMPDMAHSIAYEANYSSYYNYNQFSEEGDYRKLIEPRKPVANTIARGYTGVATGASDNVHDAAFGIPANGFVPYYYEDTEEDRLRATADMTTNPFTLTDAGLAQGKELYNVYCGICHGEKADGNGYLVRDANAAKGDLGGKYPSQPSNLTDDEYKGANVGRFYHAIMYGKNVMGSYKDKLSYEERWQVIHYIRSLQFGDSYKPLAATASFDSSLVINTIKEVVATGKASTSALVLDNVSFATGSAILTDGSKSQLDDLVSILKSNDGVNIQINGHTDNEGDAAKNKTLSEERAKAVYDYLVGAGINGGTMSYKGFGDTDPTASNESAEGRQKNRRTDFIILN
ncbi:MAG: OmpA family protein [Saprospiraceae bacterium]